VAAIHLAGVRGEPCDAVRWTVYSTKKKIYEAKEKANLTSISIQI